MYPTDENDRQNLAADLTAKGLIPTQTKHRFDKAKIDKMAAAMFDGKFDWTRSARQPVILGPDGQVLSGHHRVVAAQLAGLDLASIPGQVRTLANNWRQEYQWHQVLPDV